MSAKKTDPQDPEPDSPDPPQDPGTPPTEDPPAGPVEDDTPDPAADAEPAYAASTPPDETARGRRSFPYGGLRRPTRHLSLRDVGALLWGGRDMLSRTIDRAEEARRTARAEQLRYDDAVAVKVVGGSVPTTTVVPVVPTPESTRPTALDSLPSWLVRAGIGAWLLLGLVIVIGMVFFVTSQIIPVFVGVFTALVFTSILQPLVNQFARIMPRYPATFLALLVTFAGVAGLVYYVVTSVTDQWDVLASQFSTGLDTIVQFVEHGPLPLHMTQDELMGQLQHLVDQGRTYVQTNAPTLATELLSNAGALVDIFAVLALALFSTIFFLASGGRMWRWFLNELPAPVRESTHRAAGAGWYTFAGYARGTVIVALTDGLMAGIFLQFIGVPLAAPLAVLVFIGAFIPIIGAPAAMIIAMVVALASKGFVTMIVVGVGVAGIGQIEGHILQPLIMGRQVSLHPVVVIIAVAVGTYAVGLLGAIVAVPLVSVLWSVYSELHVKDAPVVGELPSYSTTKKEA